VSKLESGMLQVTPVDCQPMTIVRQIQNIFDAELLSKKIDMAITQDASFNDLKVEWVRADPSRISQILINLLSNAIKFLDGRPVRKIVVTVGASTSPPRPDAIPLPSTEDEKNPNSQDFFLSFSISDTGPGLKPAEMATLFQRFSQATPRTHVTYGGSGLGLFISKRLVELQGGRIYVNSIEGKGSTFSFYIKTQRSVAAVTLHEPIPKPLPAREEIEANRHRVHVLVVEVSIRGAIVL
jgi:signal transduction histidine kinase